jgi:serine/threonine protein kinase
MIMALFMMVSPFNFALMADIKPSNILLCFGRTDWTITEVLAMENSSDVEPDPDKDRITTFNVPEIATFTYGWNPIKFVQEGDMVDLSKMTVKIANFGCARNVGEDFSRWPDHLTAPEIILQTKSDCSADIWRWGMLVSSF